MNKWNEAFWVALGERAGASAVGGVLAMVTADSTGVADYSAKAWWVLVGIPTATAVLKGLLSNLAVGDGPGLVPAEQTLSNGERGDHLPGYDPDEADLLDAEPINDAPLEPDEA